MRYTEEEINSKIKALNSTSDTKSALKDFQLTLKEISKTTSWIDGVIAQYNNELYKLVAELIGHNDTKIRLTSLNIIQVNYDRFLRFEDTLSDDLAKELLTGDHHVIVTMKQVYEATISDIQSLLQISRELEENKLEVEYQELINDFKEGLHL